MEFLPYLQVLWRRKWVILATTLLTVGVAVLVTLIMPPAYRTTVLMRVVTPDDSGWNNTPYADRLNNTYSRLVESDTVMDELVERLGLSEAPDVTVNVIPNTELMEIIVDTPDANVANTLADILIARNRELYFGDRYVRSQIIEGQIKDTEDELDAIVDRYGTTDLQLLIQNNVAAEVRRQVETLQQRYANLQAQYNAAVVLETSQQNALFVAEAADPPKAPFRPNPILNIVVGVILGLLGGTLLALLFENIDTLLYSTRQIEKVTNAPTLGRIPVARRKVQVGALNDDFALAEAYRRLRVNISAETADLAMRKLVFVSAEPREGKSAVIANLAAVIGQSEQRAVVVDCDLRRPQQHGIFGLTNKIGLSTVLQGKTALEDAVRATRLPGVAVLTSGPAPANPAELLASPHLYEVLNVLAEQYDYVLIDTPAMQAVADASFLMPAVDGVLLVVGRRQVKQESVKSALEQLHTLKARLVGVIVNRAEADTARVAFYARHYQPDAQPEARKAQPVPATSE